MKRAKIMLTAIAVLAVVGGALAFKANSKFANTYCILTTLVQKGKCTGELSPSKFVDPGEVPVATYYYTTKTAGAICVQKDCTLSTSFKKD